MARPRAASICPTPGCPNDQPCPAHPKQAWAGSDRRSRLPKNWDTTVRRIKRRDHHTCQVCHGTRCSNQRLEVDHIERGDDHRDANLQTLGHACHQAKTTAEATQARRGA
jgi:5-methylcytosine-specific restriction protein A